MRYLITGGCGFIGSNLARRVLENKAELMVFDNLSRAGSEENLKWLKTQGSFQFIQGDIRSTESVSTVIQQYRPNIIFHMAGQVAMTTSLQNPRLDFETNVLGTLNVLEAIKQYIPRSLLIYSSTNKVYGDLESIVYQEMPLRYTAVDYPDGFDESTPLHFTTPYGCSKGAADQYVLDYAKMFGLSTIVFRHSSVFGDRQFGTYDQGWIGWFVQQALKTQSAPQHTFTISGNGKQVRDVLFVSDLVDCYFLAIQTINSCRGQVFNLGGGMQNSLSLLELFAFLEETLSIKLFYEILPWRQSDQKVFVANIAKAEQYFHWSPKVDKAVGLKAMIQWSLNHVK